MAELGSSSPAVSISRGQKRLRKGTFSCTECRRRKIRCRFQLGDVNTICVPCSSRGSMCIGQRESVAVQQESVPLQETTDQSEFLDIGSGNDNHQAPFISTLHHAGLLQTVGSRPNEVISNQVPFTAIRKAESVCASLRSLLPSYDVLVSILSRKGAWWSSFRQKTDAITSAPATSLIDFAARSYTSSNPAELGILTTAYARSMGKEQHHVYAIIDSLVISDFTYAATLEGMECLILLAKSYTDIGQPRRAWFVWRKGIAIAQLMGLHRENKATPASQRIWWTTYHGDRFTSMLIGLPYGFNDAHFGPITETLAYTSGSADHRFILRCVLCAGKVIDRNTAPGTPSFAKAMELDEEMDKISASMPTNWWNVQDESTRIGTDLEMDTLRERLLQQFYFFHVKIYIHLPFLAKSTTTISASAVSRLACMESARQMLTRFQVLRTETIHGTCLFECKTSDFVGFMAATVLLIGISTSNLDGANALQHQDDLRLIEDVERSFEREKHECKLAAQCWMTLRILSQTLRNPHTETSNLANEIQEINIPYFGVVVRKSVKYTTKPSLPANLDSNSAAINSNYSSYNEATTIFPTSATLGYNVRPDEHMINYWGYELPDLVPGSHPHSESFGFSSTGTPSSWLDPAFLDIDQDWGSLLDIDHWTNI